MNNVSVILLTLSLILFSGFAVTRITKYLKLPNVSGYILAGVLIGPSVLYLVPEHILSEMGFISDIALAFIAFGVGKFFKKKVFVQAGVKVIIITLFEALFAGILVTFSMYFLFRQDLLFSLLLGAIATATAPASTMMTINQYHAKGEFVNVLLQVVAFDECRMSAGFQRSKRRGQWTEQRQASGCRYNPAGYIQSACRRSWHSLRFFTEPVVIAGPKQRKPSDTDHCNTAWNFRPMLCL